MKDEILSKMLEGFLAGLLGSVNVEIAGLKADDGCDEVTVEKITITPLEEDKDEDQSL